MNLDFNDGLPPLLRYQKRWCDETARFAVCEKARRIGLSWGDAAERVAYAGEGSGSIYYQSYNKDMTETYIEDCADWARTLGWEIGSVIDEMIIHGDESINRFRIDFANGQKIIALSSNPRVLRSKGKPGDIVIIDEAAFCDNIQELIKAATAVTQWGGRVRIISTHNGSDNPFNELVQDIRAGRHPQYALHRITLDDAVADGLARRVFSVTKRRWYEGAASDWRDEIYGGYTSTEAADEELLCIPKQGGGVYFTRVLVESRMVDAPVLRFEGSASFNALPEPTRRAQMEDWLDENVLPILEALDPKLRHVIGMDFARKKDMSVLAPLAILANLHRFCPFLLEMHNVPHKQQEQALKYVCDRLPRFSGGAVDATGNGSFIAESAVDMFGSIMEELHLTESWYRENMPKYKAAYEDATITIPKHDDVLQDHRAFRLVRGVARLPAGKTDKDGERHGDAAMALAIGYYASEQSRGPFEFMSDGPSEAHTLIHDYMGGMSNRGYRR